MTCGACPPPSVIFAVDDPRAMCEVLPPCNVRPYPLLTSTIQVTCRGDGGASRKPCFVNVWDNARPSIQCPDIPVACGESIVSEPQGESPCWPVSTDCTLANGQPLFSFDTSMGDSSFACTAHLHNGLPNPAAASCSGNVQVLPLVDGECGCISDEALECATGPHAGLGNYTYTFRIVNASGITARYVLLPGVNIATNVIPLDPPLPSGQARSVTARLTGLTQPNQTFCFEFALADERFNKCCSQQHCIFPPPCSTCLEFPSTTTACIAGAPAGTFELQFDLTNRTQAVGEHVFLIPPDGSGVTIIPDYIDIPPVPPMGTLPAVGPVRIEGGNPGETLCIQVTLHDETLQECCTEQLCFSVPDPCPGNPSPPPAQGGVSIACSSAPAARLASGSRTLGALLALLLVAGALRRRRRS